MKRRVYVAWALILSAALALTGCGGLTTSGAGGEKGALGPQVLDMTIQAEPPNLDSAVSTDTVSFNVLNNVMEGLYRLDRDNKPKPAIASSVEISPDKKTYTFHLRDANWSDGEPVTAHDFEYAWKRALDPNTTGAEYAYILFPIVNAEEFNQGKAKAEDVGVRAVDDKTLKVQLKSPTPYFLSLTTFATYLPQRKDIVEKYGEEYAKEPDKMVYNGPFVISEWKHEQSLQYKKNDKYWDRNAVRLEEVNLNIVKDISTGVNLYTSGKTDTAKLDSAFADAFKQSPEYLPVSTAMTQYLQFNTDHEFLSNEKIRKAISYAIDRESLVKNILKDGSEPAYGLVPPAITGSENTPFREKAKAGHEFNPTDAKRLMKEGMEELGFTKKPTLELLSYDDERKKVAVFIQEQLRNNLDLEVQINPQPFKQKLDRESKGHFELTYAGWAADYNDPINFLEILLSDSPFNRGDWKNTQYDELIKKSQGNPNNEQRTRDMIEAEKIMVEKAPIAPIIYGGEVYLQKQYVENLIRHPFGAEYSLKWAYISEGKEE